MTETETLSVQFFQRLHHTGISSPPRSLLGRECVLCGDGMCHHTQAATAVPSPPPRGPGRWLSEPLAASPGQHNLNPITLRRSNRGSHATDRGHILLSQTFAADAVLDWVCADIKWGFRQNLFQRWREKNTCQTRSKKFQLLHDLDMRCEPKGPGCDLARPRWYHRPRIHAS